MNLASAVGFIMVALATVFGISFVMATGSFDFELLLNFWDIPSVFIVIGGSLASMLITQDSIKAFLSKIASIKLVFRTVKTNEFETIRTIIALSNVARKEGLLALEEATNEIEDEFLQKGVLLIVDGTDPELVQAIFDTELSCMEDRHNDVIGFWDSLGAMAPAWGMLGTLFGLINMLGDLSDPSTIGPNMAVALITTFYGSLVANGVCIPVVSKLKNFHQRETMTKEIIVEGILSIQAGENPRVIEEKLKSFIKPSNREELNQGEEFESEGVNV